MKPVIHDYHPGEPSRVQAIVIWVLIALVLVVPVLFVVLMVKAAAVGIGG